MKHLLIISILLINIGCNKTTRSFQNPKADKSCILKFRPSFKTILYNAKIDVIGKHLSGLLLFKTMSDSSTRIVFSNEMGVKFFDFEYNGSNFKVIYCINKLNKKVVIRQLKEDLGYLLMFKTDTPIGNEINEANENYTGFIQNKNITYYITNKDCSKLLRIENKSKNRIKIIINLTDYNLGMPDSVNIAHQLYPFNINLKQIGQ